jgi:F-type H+-transporting ATPase subunit b
MRLRALLASVLLAGVVVVSTPHVAFAESQSEITKCLEEKQKEADAQGHAPNFDDCQKAPNPILPATNELIWGALSFLVLFAVLAKFGYPAIKNAMDARANRIRDSLDEAERAKSEAQSVLDEYQRQLADAKSEAARIIEEARQAADNLRQDLRRQAESEVNELKQRAQEDIQAQVDRAMTDLRSQVATLAIELAERVVERNLDRDTQLALVESFINQVGSTS